MKCLFDLIDFGILRIILFFLFCFIFYEIRSEKRKFTSGFFNEYQMFSS